MNYIVVDKDNINQEHICCCISDKKGESCVSSKKAWLLKAFDDGLVFLKLNERGKVFIEYMPAEFAWCPIAADGYMHINCFWVSGKFKGQGLANELLEKCIADAKAKGKLGITVVSSVKKKSFLSDPDYLKYKGFVACDTASPFFVLYYLPFADNAPTPCFKNCAKSGTIDEMGMVLYYCHQCPHTVKYAKVIVDIASKYGLTISLHEITTTAEAQNAPSPFTTYSFYYNGVFVDNEIFSGSKFEKFLTQHRLNS